MLVLSRKKNESVVLGDEVTVTVEEIHGNDGERLSGMAVRLGFQLPRSVPVCRGELRAKRWGASHFGGKEKPAPPSPPGKTVTVSDAEVRLRIELPPKIPVSCNGRPMVGIDSETKRDGATGDSQSVYHLTCRREDRITICHNITIATLDFRRFVFFKDR